jgi:hypothetical protein
MRLGHRLAPPATPGRPGKADIPATEHLTQPGHQVAPTL